MLVPPGRLKLSPLPKRPQKHHLASISATSSHFKPESRSLKYHLLPSLSMGENSSRPASFAIKDEPIENQRPMRVIVIGAGFSGIYTTIRLSQRLRNVSIQVYEQNEEVSGVWWV